MLPSEFIASHFRDTVGSIYLCSLPNERGTGKPAEICGRGSGDRIDELVLHQWGRPDRGTFFCVNTLKPRQSRRAKEIVHEIICLHTDVDFNKIDIAPDAALTRLNQLTCLPSKIVHSGNGVHCYWLLNEAVPATSKTIPQVEALLRRLSDIVGGDPAVCEVARVMRLPGSYNTKNGSRIPVRIVEDRPLRYELSDLEEWISETRVLIPRKGETLAPSNPFLAAGVPACGGPSVDVDARLEAMRHQGSDETSIHQTQVSVSAAMLNRGASVDETVSAVLAATRKAAGQAGERWNWAHEEKDIRAMCSTWVRKRLNGQQQPTKHIINMLDDLMTKEFKPSEHFVPDLIPAEGVTLLVAKSKVGKSWMLYDICISATLDRECLGGRKPKQGRCLYLALEDSEKRLRNWGEKLLGFNMGSCPVATATTWDRVDQGGLQLIKDWVESTRAQGHVVVCVCIDVLQMIRPLGGERQSVFQRDYMAVQGLRSLASELGIAIIVACHQRKGSADDLQDTISGTQGLPAAADCSIVLERQLSGGFILDVRGRDIEAQQLAATFDKETCRWNVGGDANEMKRIEAQRLILDALRGTPEGLKPLEIGAETGLKAGTIRSALLRMRRDGEVKKVGSKYMCPS